VVDLAAVGPFTLLGLLVGSAVFWLQYWDLKDRLHPEPRRLLVFAFLLGVAAAGLALALFHVAGAAGVPIDPGPTAASTALFCFAVVGPIEEGAKFLAARLVVFRWAAFDEPLDGLVYGAAIALGFASFENLIYLPQLTTIEGVLRTIASPLTHSIFAMVWALPTARALLGSHGPAGRVFWQALGLVTAAALHGAYDYLVIAHGATVLAAALVAAVWITVIVWARRTLTEARRGESAGDGTAPTSSLPR
jgi:RsiW-degrading membrane proteinase PrsW (M82 family)